MMLLCKMVSTQYFISDDTAIGQCQMMTLTHLFDEISLLS